MVLSVEIRPQKRKYNKGNSKTFPVLNPTPQLNPTRMWHAQQRNLFILDKKGTLYKRLDLNRFDPFPADQAKAEDAYQTLKSIILEAMYR